MERAISNLLSNALRYSPAGSEITIDLKENQEDLLIQIKDEGKGIPAEHLDFIFDRYYQVDKNSMEGTGIGLALTKEIVGQHGGAIKVESESGVGTVFTIIISDGMIQEESKVESPTKATSRTVNGHAIKLSNLPNIPLINIKETLPDEVQRPTILIVEDQEEVRSFLSSIIFEDAEVLIADNGEAGLAIARKAYPDLIICDIMMPEMDGLELTKRLKSELRTSHIPVILLMAKASIDSKLTGLKTGADDYLTKPFNIEELRIRSYNLIKQRKELKRLFNARQAINVEQIVVNKLDEEFLDKALKVVRQQLSDASFNIEKFTQEIRMSRTNLYTKIKALTGKNISEFVRTLRIQKAVALIKSNSGNMNDIAYSTGFNNRQSFIKSFKEEMKVTPTEYKKSLSFASAKGIGRK